jgi:hypothetical protein
MAWIMGSHMTGSSNRIAQVEYIRDMIDHNTKSIPIPAPKKKRSKLYKWLTGAKG